MGWLIKGVIGVGALAFLAFAGFVGAEVWPHVRPLDRSAEQIQSTWDRASGWMPSDPEVPAVSKRTVLVLENLRAPEDGEALDPAVAAQVVEWYEGGPEVPIAGCGLSEGIEGADPAEVGVFHVFHAAKVLLVAGHPDAALDLAQRTQHGELVNFMVGIAIAKLAADEGIELGAARPSAEGLFDSLAYEAYCFDQVLGRLGEHADELADEGLAWRGPLLNPRRERLIHRWHYGDLLVQLHPLRDDAPAMSEVLKTYAERPHPIRGSLVARLGWTGVATVAFTALEDIEGLE